MSAVAERPARPVLGIRLGHLVAWELAAILLVYGSFGAGPSRYPALAAGAVLLLCTVLRIQRRWLYDWLFTRLRFWTRRKGHTGHDTATQLAPLRALLPELDVYRAEGRSRTRMGVIHDGRAWIAVVGVERGDTLTDQADGGLLPVAQLSELLRMDDIRFESVQVLVQSVTAPSGPDAASELCPTSYQELNADRTPLTQSAWIALRLDGAGCPEAIAARGGGEAGIRRALRRGVVRATNILEDEGWQARVLDETEATEILASLAGLRAAAPGETRPPVTEGWTACRADAEHVSYWVRDWSTSGNGLTDLQDLLGMFPARSSAISITYAERPGGHPGCNALIRTTGGAAQATGALVNVAAERGLRLVRLDGEQAAGLLATLPLGRSAGAHVLDVPNGRVELALRREGVALGTFRDRSTATVRLLRHRPVRLGVFLPRTSAELLVFRLLSVGTTVHVRSPQPHSWASLMRAAGVVPHRMVISLPGGATPPAGSPLAPVAVVDDVVSGTGAPRADLGHWQVGVTLQPKVPTGGAEELRRYDAVLVPRVTPQVARALRDAYRLPEGALRMLPLLPGGAAALILPGRAEIIDFATTRVESRLLGFTEQAHA
ncbi:type VII secretion protein EccE [Streptomyces sp. NPDC056632]|uniref:type VII secretion protein EccE n=1 Tax=Streptomyces sp. NPDC056632 TaxID=3345884 RepID=UPI0036C206FD